MVTMLSDASFIMVNTVELYLVTVIVRKEFMMVKEPDKNM